MLSTAALTTGMNLDARWELSLATISEQHGDLIIKSSNACTAAAQARPLRPDVSGDVQPRKPEYKGIWHLLNSVKESMQSNRLG